MSLPQLSSWLVGIASGYTPPGVLPAEAVVGTIAMSSFVTLFLGMDNLSKEALSTPIRTSIVGSIGTSLFFGSIFVIGHQVGVALRCALKEQLERRDD